ncbi:hypothetical protein JCM10450v2_002550 [Rhodotorula kratochvilovae]
MPLLPPGDLSDPQSILGQVPASTSPSAPHFLVLFASVDPNTGKPWCPDCADVQGEVERLIPDNKSTLVFVGDRTEWRDPNNKFRQPPFSIDRIPTIIRIEQGGDAVANSLDSAPRLVESELRDHAKFEQFVASK